MEPNRPILLSLHSRLYLEQHSGPKPLLVLEVLGVPQVVLFILKALLRPEVLQVAFLCLRATLLRDPPLLKVLQCGRVLRLQNWYGLWFG